MKKFVFSMLACLAMQQLCAQTSQVIYLKEHPVWITMMDDVQVNYYDAIQAFDIFWEDKDLPVLENDLFEASESEKQSSDFIVQQRANKSQVAIRYAFEYKKFLHWKEKMQPFVKADGRIMNDQERLAMWKEQLKGRK